MRYLVNDELVELTANPEVTLEQRSDRILVKTPEGQATALTVRSGDKVLISYEGQVFRVEKPSGKRTSGKQGATGEARAPMPGQVVDVFVEQGEQVQMGQKLLILEAMKMQHAVTAPFDGVVKSLPVSKGMQVTEGQPLVHVEAANDSTTPTPTD